MQTTKKKFWAIVCNILLFSVSITISAKSNPKKHVIGAHPNGFFSAFIGVLNHLDWCERSNKIPVVYWKRGSLYYDEHGFNGKKNVWEYYFKPVTDLKYERGDYIDKNYSVGDWTFYYFSLEQEKRDRAHALISKYVRLNRPTRQKIDAFYNQHIAGRKTIGIHLRGTDKWGEERLVSPEEMVKIALEYADDTTQFLIASDEHRLINRMIELLQGHTVIHYQCHRSSDDRPLHRKPPSKAQLGEDVLVEVSLLSRCDMLIHTLSNVSTAALYFNHRMPHVLVTKN
jgi:hypothetical protein